MWKLKKSTCTLQFTVDISDKQVKANPREKFVELAEKRVNRALKDISLVGNLSNRSNYSYTDQDVKKITTALRKAIDEMKARFDRKGGGSEDTFKL